MWVFMMFDEMLHWFEVRPNYQIFKKVEQQDKYTLDPKNSYKISLIAFASKCWINMNSKHHAKFRKNSLSVFREVLGINEDCLNENFIEIVWAVFEILTKNIKNAQ